MSVLHTNHNFVSFHTAHRSSPPVLDMSTAKKGFEGDAGGVSLLLCRLMEWVWV